MALPTRLVNTWRSRWASPRSSCGIPGDTREWKSSPFAFAWTRSNWTTSVDRIAQLEVQILEGDLPRLDLGQVQDVVDERQQRLPAVLRHVGVARCSGVRSVSSSSCTMPITPFMGVRISWLMLARKRLLARLAASAPSRA